MKYYFKARTNWRGGVETLSDAEAGRLFKSLLQFAETEEAPLLGGREGVLLSMFLAELRRDVEKRDRISKLRANAGKSGGMAKASKCKQMLANASKCQQMLANASKCQQMLDLPAFEEKEKRSPLEPPLVKEKEVGRACAREGGGDGFLTDDEADSLASALQDVYDAAEHAGFPTNPATLDKLTELGAAYSPARVLAALDVAAERGKNSIGYLRGILAREGQAEALEATPSPPALPVLRFDRVEGEPEGVKVPGLPNIRLV